MLGKLEQWLQQKPNLRQAIIRFTDDKEENGDHFMVDLFERPAGGMEFTHQEFAIGSNLSRTLSKLTSRLHA